MEERRALVRTALGAQPGERILDVGCGPGYYAADLAATVGADGLVVGVDSSPEMLTLAQSRCAGLPNVEFRKGDAAAPPAAEGEFDAALSVQVMEYVTDPTAALEAIGRCLVPGGRLVVWDTDWATLSWHSRDPGRMERVLRVFDEHLAHPSLPRTLAPRLRVAGFSDVRFTCHTAATSELSADTVPGPLVGLVSSFVSGRGGISPDEATAWAAEQHALAESGEAFFACTQFCFTATRT